MSAHVSVYYYIVSMEICQDPYELSVNLENLILKGYSSQFLRTFDVCPPWQPSALGKQKKKCDIVSFFSA